MNSFVGPGITAKNATFAICLRVACALTVGWTLVVGIPSVSAQERAVEKRRTGEQLQQMLTTLQRLPGGSEAVGQLVTVLASHPDPRIRQGELAETLVDEFLTLGAVVSPEATAIVHAENGQFDRAVAAQRQFIKQSAMLPRAQREQLRERLGLFERKVPYRQQYPQTLPELVDDDQTLAHACLLASLRCRDAGFAEASRVLMAQGVLLAPKDPLLRRQLGKSLQADGVVQLALSEFSTAIQLAPKDAENWFLLGEALLRLGRFEESRSPLEKALALQPDWDQAAMALAWALAVDPDEERRQPERAQAILSPFVSDTDDWVILDAHAVVLAALGEFEQASRELERAIQLAGAANEGLRPLRIRQQLFALKLPFHGTLKDACTTLGNTYLQQKELDEAEDWFRQAIALDPRDGQLFRSLGVIANLRGQREKAIGYYRRSLELSPGASEVAQYLAWALATHEDASSADIDEAVRLSELAVRATASPEPGRMETLAVAYAADGRFEAALRVLRRAVEILLPRDPTWAARLANEEQLFLANQRFFSVPQMHLELGRMAYAAGKLDDAQAFFTSAAKVTKHRADALHALGLVEESLQRPQAAIEQYEAALAADPNHRLANMRLAWLLATADHSELRNPPRAVDLARRVLELDDVRTPDEFEVLSEAYAADGKLNEAQETLTTALRLLPDADGERRQALEAKLRTLFEQGL